MANKGLGIADPGYDALRIYSGQSIAPDLGGGTTGGSGLENKIYVWHADGSTIDMFDPTDAGLTAAIAAASAGDLVQLHAANITGGPWTVPADIELSGLGDISQLTGNVTNNGTLGNLMIVGQVVNNGLMDLTFVHVDTGPGVTQTLATAGIHRCVIEANQGAGEYAVDISGGSMRYTLIDHVGGAGTGLLADGATVTLAHCYIGGDYGAIIRTVRDVSECGFVCSQTTNTYYAVLHDSGTARLSNCSFFANGTAIALKLTANTITLTDCTWNSIVGDSYITYGTGDRAPNNGLLGFPAVVVAASDASADSKASAKYVCDGTNDDVEIAAALGDLPAGGGQVVLSEGTFNISTTVNISSSFVKVSGQGSATVVEVQADIYAFALNGGSGTGWYYPDAQARVRFEGITFTTSSARVGGAIAALNTVSNMAIRNCFLLNLSKGIEIRDKAHATQITDNYFEGNHYSIYIHDADAKAHDWLIAHNKESGMENANWVSPCFFVFMDDGEMYEWVISDNSIEHTRDTGTHTSAGIYLHGAANADIVIEGNSIEESDCGIDYLGNLTLDGITMSNLLVTGNSLRDLVIAIKVSGTASVLSEGNQYINYPVQHPTDQANVAFNMAGDVFYCRDNFLTGYQTSNKYVESGTTPAGIYDIIDVDTATVSTDETVKVSSNDTTAGYLNGKLVEGSNITLTENNDGGDETLTIAATGGSNPQIYNETIAADGISTIYYLLNTASPSTIRVYIDGIRQPATDDAAPTDVVTFDVAPDLGAVLLFDYEMDLT